MRKNTPWLHFHTHKGSSVLVHQGTPTHSLTEGVHQEFGGGKIGDALIKVYCSMALRQLRDFIPVDDGMY